jgi:DNA polymerase I-like protein with 3'-5' exonuclease and polymerase domains
MNFPMQAAGADILRQACIQLDRGGFELCAPIHDAVLVECDEVEAGEAAEAVQAEMVSAAAVVLGDGRIKTDTMIVRYPDRYLDERGKTLWPEMMSLLKTVSQPEVGVVV